jgi:hypothetical protein
LFSPYGNSEDNNASLEIAHKVRDVLYQQRCLHTPGEEQNIRIQEIFEVAPLKFSALVAALLGTSCLFQRTSRLRHF